MRDRLPARPFVVPVRGVKAMGIDLEWIPQDEARGRRTRIRLVAEPDNPADENAVRVDARRLTRDGIVWERVGYIPRTLAARLTPAEWEASLEAVLWHEQTPTGLRLRVFPRVALASPEPYGTETGTGAIDRGGGG